MKTEKQKQREKEKKEQETKDLMKLPTRKQILEVVRKQDK
jgi:hypothetical protein|tara:strand:+ start:381 stop:500 length:120 start_codon:yes stop_codon:yes gene_type:complete